MALRVVRVVALAVAVFSVVAARGADEWEVISGNSPHGWNSPMGVAVDRDGTVYVVDYQNIRLQIRDPVTLQWAVEGTFTGGPNGGWPLARTERSTWRTLTRTTYRSETR